MNSTPQLDFHPDAESLNAFAEKALPERERAQVLDHLAVCSRCRQVIFLAQEEAAGMEMVAAAVPAAQTTARRGSWLNGWRLAWIPAVALAASAALVVLVHVRHVEPGTEMAKVSPQTLPHEEENIAKPPLRERVITVKPHATVSNVLKKQSEIKFEPAPAGAAYVPAPAAQASHQAVAAETVTGTSPPPLLMSSNASAGQVVQAEPPNQAQIAETPLNGRNWGYIGQLTAGQNHSTAPSAVQQPAKQLPQRATGTYSSNATAGYAPKAKKDEMAERAPASPGAEAQLKSSGGAFASQYHQEAVPRSSYDGGAHIPGMQFEAAPEAKTAPLPSGLPIVSKVTAQDRTLAIDQAGTLFLSEDSGSSWVSVARQWTGRAVSVSLVQPGTGGLPSAGGTDSMPAEAFEIVNDQHQIWVSTDGMSWKAR